MSRILERVKRIVARLPEKDREEFDEFYDNLDVYTEKGKDAELKEVEQNPTQYNLKKEKQEEKDIKKLEKKDNLSKDKSHEIVEGENAVLEDEEGEEYEPEKSDEKETEKETTAEDESTRDYLDDEDEQEEKFELSDRERDLHARIKSLEEENQKLKDERKGYALDTPKYGQKATKSETAPVRKSTYDAISQKYFK